MSKTKKVVLTLCLVFVFAFVVLAYLMFHGYFDNGHFEIQEVKTSDRGLVAMVARRIDTQGLSGDQYYVVIGTHVFSPAELRRALYSDKVIFRADGPCLSVSWSDPDTLNVSCAGGNMVSDHIAVEKHRAGDIKITYSNVPEKAAI